MAQQSRGTRAVFGSWLSQVKHMTYTKYSHLATPQKLEIQAAYKKRGKENVRVAGQSNQTQEGEAIPVQKG